MKKYEVYQVYASAYAVHLNKKLDRKFYKGIFEAKDIVTAIRNASRRTDIPQICLHAELVQES